MKKTGFICDESYFWHSNGDSALMLPAGSLVEKDIHVENAETKRRVKNLLERSKFIKQLNCIEPREATRDELELNHSSKYITKVQQLSKSGGGDLGNLTHAGPDSYEIASLAVGGALTGVDEVMEGNVQNVYALTRPPGHHAEKDYGAGFCLFNNVAIAAKYAKEKYNLKKVMIIDWDVHHGNGTESSFYDDPDILFISLHQEFVFPAGRGNVEDIGDGKGKGYNVNIPLPAGTGDEGYLLALKEIVVPIANQFKPELVLISAGQDASRFDPLGRMLMTAKGFAEMTKIIKRIADRYANGRIVACHEGGYSQAYVPFCTLKIIETLSGLSSNVKDPFPDDVHGAPIYDIQKRAIEKVRKIQSAFWDLSHSVV
ncbi:class II histone deacetylase [Oceanobacillus polygoni]|uniref:Acetoin utilization deacetylase AcuC-like enzyme n=1 Tax=Oceanobacillus polygoni TaxID=1235259 RepID=A0A9X0YN43_9BACI|nr:class II histone deacetylase [Oceanobacillus polygoni]MBP2076043.1 acetoin utilization deacetylase AcuC-like enzyme [Oceanobacillus polygoni]